MIYIENTLNEIQAAKGINTLKPVDFSGAPTVKLPAGTTINGSTVTSLGTITSTSANALVVGPNGTTNPTLNVDASTVSAATGINIKSAAAGNGVVISIISSGTNEGVTFDAKGSGNITIGGISTGLISLGRGRINNVIFSNTVSSLGTTQNSTPTAAQLLGGIVTQTGSTGGGTVTTPTGSVLSSAISGVATGDMFDTLFCNLGGSQNLVITAGSTGMTVIGNATVPSGKNALLTFVCTGSNTWNCYVTVSA